MRFLTVMICVFSLVAVARVTDMILGQNTVTDELFVADISAKQPSDDEKDKKKETDDKKDEKSDKKEEEKEPKEEKEKKHSANDITKREKVFSDVEVELLQNLAKRRKALDQWHKTLIDKENMFKATELKIDRKIVQLKELKEELQMLMTEYNREEDKKIKRLVKIYETMKPKSAANIFNQMETPIVLQVIGKMKEAKAAQVLAKMNQARAKEITTKLALQHKLSIAKVPSL